MSDEHDGFDIPAYLRFIAHRVGGDEECPICRKSDWVFEVPTEPWVKGQPVPAPTYVLKSRGLMLDGLSAIPALSLTCENCGFMRQHNMTWLRMKMKDEIEDQTWTDEGRHDEG